MQETILSHIVQVSRWIFFQLAHQARCKSLNGSIAYHYRDVGLNGDMPWLYNMAPPVTFKVKVGLIFVLTAVISKENLNFLWNNLKLKTAFSSLSGEMYVSSLTADLDRHYKALLLLVVFPSVR